MNSKIDNIKVSVIITTYNRYQSLLKAIESVQNQTHRNIEIIVVNDKSSQQDYYCQDKPKNVIWVDLDKSSREVYGYPAPGYPHNVGLLKASGEYIAILDDDDVWMPQKLNIQLNAMVNGNWQFSCTEGFMGDGLYNSNIKYPLYYKEYYRKFCKNFFLKYYNNGIEELPDVFDFNLIEKHNFIIHSSVVMEKTLLMKVGGYKDDIMLRDKSQPTIDTELWLRILKHVDCLYIKTPLVYYDGRLSQKKITNIIRKRFIKYFKIQ